MIDNPYAAPEASIAPDAPRADDPLAPQIASPGWRFVAFLVDYFLVIILAYALLAVLMIVAGYGLPQPFGAENPSRIFGDEPILLFGFLFWTVYSVTWESSSWQATPGKRLFRLRVVGLDGARLSFGRSFARACIKLIGVLACYVGVLPILFTRRRQALHDLLAGTVVLRGTPGKPAATV